MYTNRSRLEAVLRTVTAREGAGTLDHPHRLRALLVAGFRAAGMDQGTDVDELVLALAGGSQDLIRMTEPAEIAADRLSERRGISFPDAIWTVDTVRSILDNGTNLMNNGPDQIPLQDAALLSAPSRIVPHVAGQESSMIAVPASSARWPTRARRVAMALVAVAVVLIACLVTSMLVARSHSKSASDRLSAALGQLGQQKNRTTSVGNDLTTMQSEVNDLTSRLATAQSQLNTANSDQKTMTAQLETTRSGLAGAKTDLASANSDAGIKSLTIDTLNGKLSTAQDELTKSMADASATHVALNTANAKFDVDITAIRSRDKFFTVTGKVLDCQNFVLACDPTRTFYGHLISSGGNVSFEWPGYLLVPLSTVDGFTYTGVAPVADIDRIHCDSSKAPIPTTVSVSISPTHYTVSSKGSQRRGVESERDLDDLCNGDGPLRRQQCPVHIHGVRRRRVTSMVDISARRHGHDGSPARSRHRGHRAPRQLNKMIFHRCPYPASPQRTGPHVVTLRASPQVWPRNMHPATCAAGL